MAKITLKRPVPKVQARRARNGDIFFYCPFCERDHQHAGDFGPRVAHCSNPSSPFRVTDYVLVDIGMSDELYRELRRYAQLWIAKKKHKHQLERRKKP